MAMKISLFECTRMMDEEVQTDALKTMEAIAGKAEPSVLIVHNAIDGISTAVLAIAGGFEGDIYSAPAESVTNELLQPYKHIYMSDIGISRDLFMRLISQGKDIHIYDHHARNSFIMKYEGSVMDPRRSSTRIFFEERWKNRFLFPETVEEFVNSVDIVSRWQLDDPRFQRAARILHLYYGLYEKSKLSYGMLYKDGEFGNLRDTAYLMTCVDRLLKPQPNFFTKEDFDIINSEIRKLNKCFRNTMKTISYRTDGIRRRFAVCKVFGNPSLILDRILKRSRNLSYVIGIGEINQGMAKVSARSRDVSIDLNRLEGFEGHPTAAGAIYTVKKAHALLYNKKLYIGTERNQQPYRWEDRPSLKERSKRGAPPRRLRERMNADDI